jgi:hypothetical protein
MKKNSKIDKEINKCTHCNNTHDVISKKDEKCKCQDNSKEANNSKEED